MVYKSRFLRCSDRQLVLHVEGDGGTFRLKPASGGALALNVLGDELRMEAENGFIEVGGRSSDDNLVILPQIDRRKCIIGE